VAKRIQYFVRRRSTIDGFGCFAIVRIAKGRRIVEYTGRRMTAEQADAQPVRSNDRSLTYFFAVDDDTVIDGRRSRTGAQFINHSCAPNCTSVVVGKRVFITTLKTVNPGEELTYDYRLELDDPYRMSWWREYRCLCKAPKCRRLLLIPRKKNFPGLHARAWKRVRSAFKKGLRPEPRTLSDTRKRANRT
jgi:uncharacterized protein